jgi:hypothetical protein
MARREVAALPFSSAAPRRQSQSHRSGGVRDICIGTHWLVSSVLEDADLYHHGMSALAEALPRLTHVRSLKAVLIHYARLEKSLPSSHRCPFPTEEDLLNACFVAWGAQLEALELIVLIRRDSQVVPSELVELEWSRLTSLGYLRIHQDNAFSCAALASVRFRSSGSLLHLTGSLCLDPPVLLGPYELPEPTRTRQAVSGGRWTGEGGEKGAQPPVHVMWHQGVMYSHQRGPLLDDQLENEERILLWTPPEDIVTPHLKSIVFTYNPHMVPLAVIQRNLDHLCSTSTSLQQIIFQVDSFDHPSGSLDLRPLQQLQHLRMLRLCFGQTPWDEDGLEAPVINFIRARDLLAACDVSWRRGDRMRHTSDGRWRSTRSCRSTLLQPSRDPTRCI